MLKKDVRKKLSEKRKLLSLSDITTKSIAIANASLHLPIWQYSNFHIFMPINQKKEVDTEAIIAIALGKDKHVIIPKVVSDNTLGHYLLTDNTRFIMSKWGVPEPSDGITVEPKKIDVVFLPLLGFDCFGNRIGYGKGYYDRFLKECRKETLKIGLSFFEAEDTPIEDVSEHDIPLDYCITPEKTYSFPPSVGD